MRQKVNKSLVKRQLKASKNQVNVVNNLKIPTTCPYCGGNMKIVKIGDLDPKSPRANKLICICEYINDACSCSLKIERTLDGKLIAGSIMLCHSGKIMKRQRDI